MSLKMYFIPIFKVEICRTQLFLPAEDYSGDPPTPPEAWREKCSSLLKKSVRLWKYILVTFTISPPTFRCYYLTLKFPLNEYTAGSKLLIKTYERVSLYIQLKPIKLVHHEENLHVLLRCIKEWWSWWLRKSVALSRQDNLL